MANISIDSYTLTQNPASVTIVRKYKPCAAVETYSSMAVFEWAVTIIGKEIELTWEYLGITDFDELDKAYQKSGAVVYDPQDGNSKTYNVHIMELDGEYHRMMETGYRKNVKMKLRILSEVT